jgi:hypothetical protein
MQIIEKRIPNSIIHIVEITRFGPKRYRDTLYLQPVDERPQNPVLHVQEKDDYIRLEPFDLGSIGRETKRPLDKLEFTLVLIGSLHLIREDRKFPTLFLKMPPEIVIDRHTIVHYAVGDQ